MKIIANTLQTHAEEIMAEIDSNTEEYFWPVTGEHKIFEQAYMKFINRNLNYFHFPNMVAATEEPNKFNPGLPRALEFCNFVRTLTGDTGPFGRMCVWNLPAGAELLPHKDNYKYHRNIVRNIFIVSTNPDRNLEIYINNEPVDVEQGVLFQFYPAYELHSFINNSEKPFYFLGFDFWSEQLLAFAKTRINISNVQKVSARLSTFGGPKTVSKYISSH